jgi:hypothetical protein
MGKRTTPDLAAVTDALYRARSSDNWQRLLKPLTPDQRQESPGEGEGAYESGQGEVLGRPARY